MHHNYSIKSYCTIKNQTVSLNGTVLYKDVVETDFNTFIKAAFKSQVSEKYSKFFKMDELSKLAFLAADLVLNNEGISSDSPENIGIVFANKSSSLATDRKHQHAIQHSDNYYPSPAVFVYTLPNICIGEISIKYKLHTENSFFIFEAFKPFHLKTYTDSLLNDQKTEKVLCGWVEYDDEDNYEAFVYLVDRTSGIAHQEKEILKLYNK